MIRALWFMVLVAALIAGAIWLSDNPGTLTVDWLGYTVQTSMSVAVVAVVIAGVFLVASQRLIAFIIGAPGAFGRWGADRRRERGLQALTRGMVAVAAGDAETAQKMATKARGLMTAPPLTRLLAAQAAQMRGDDQVAKRQFKAMLESPDTVFLGVRGLLTQALKEGDRVEALALARRAAELQPRTGWVLATLFDLEARAGEWTAADATLRKAVKADVIKVENGRHHRAALLVERSFAAERLGRDEAALTHARDAHELLPGFAPAASRYARLLVATGKLRRAGKVVLRTWRLNPNPELVATFREVVDSYPAATRVDMFRKLAAQAPFSVESVIAVARAALDAGQWGLAREKLEAARQSHPTPRVHELLAALERAERGDDAAAEAWLSAPTHGHDPVWICRGCGATHGAWAGLCSDCGAFDALDWKAATPKGDSPKMAAPAPVVPASAVPTSAGVVPLGAGKAGGIADEMPTDVTPPPEKGAEKGAEKAGDRSPERSAAH